MVIEEIISQINIDNVTLIISFMTFFVLAAEYINRVWEERKLDNNYIALLKGRVREDIALCKYVLEGLQKEGEKTGYVYFDLLSDELIRVVLDRGIYKDKERINLLTQADYLIKIAKNLARALREAKNIAIYSGHASTAELNRRISLMREPLKQVISILEKLDAKL
jgi:hypothetical protein